MALEPQLAEFFEFGGLDLRSNNHTRSPVKADIYTNVVRTDDGAATWRKGHKKVGDNAGNNGGFGTFTHTTVNATTGATTVEKLIAGAKLYRVKDGTFTVTYTDAGTGYTSVVLSIIADETNRVWRCQIVADGTTILDQSLGVGVDEASIYTLANLETAVDALADIEAVVVGSNTVPAAYLVPRYQEQFVDSPLVLSFHYNEEVNHPTSAANPFAGSFTNRNDANYENISGVEINNLLVMTNGYDSVKCYDGVDCYRLGLPTPPPPSIAVNATGSVVAGTYKHQIQYIQIDAQGNEITSKESTSTTTVLSATDSFDVTFTNILAASGFNTDCALSVGAQATVTTITVDDGSGGAHTMKVGQTAYFFDQIANGFISRAITAKTSTTITIAGAAVTVGDNYVFSNNLRVRVQRTLIGGTVFQDVRELPNNSFTATQTINDDVLDTALGARYVVPPVTQEHLPPPNARYAAVAGSAQTGILILADQVGNVYFSDITGCFYFPLTNQFPLPSSTASPITGVSPGKQSFFVFKLRETHRVYGSLVTGQFAVQQVSQVIGCAAHASIKETDMGFMWLGDKGEFYVSTEDAAPSPIGKEVSPLFKNTGKRANKIFKSKRAVAIYDPTERIYTCYVPTEDTTGGNVHPTSDSRLFSWDVDGKEWSIWKTLNMAGGVILVDESMFWVERRFATFDSNMKYHLHKRLNDNRAEDYVDHTADIEWDIRMGWFPAGERFRKKKFLKMGVVADSSYAVADFDCQVRCELDYVPEAVRNEFTLSFGSAGAGGWSDESAWGDFAWGSPQDDTRKAHDLGMEDAVSIRPRFTFSGMYRQPVLTGWALLVAAPYKLRLAIDA